MNQDLVIECPVVDFLERTIKGELCEMGLVLERTAIDDFHVLTQLDREIILLFNALAEDAAHVVECKFARTCTLAGSTNGNNGILQNRNVQLQQIGRKLHQGHTLLR